ncbi:MAG: zinc-binding dehydrogenase [Candidatus Poribacteria bacterium]|nr:zinc-binding dehydrogenase [Candidatus Poribacteria bacterium]
MQAVYIDAIEKIRVGTAEVPVPGDDEALIRVRSAGLCGSDLHILKGEFGRLPIIPGHEFSGDVVEAGKSVTTLSPGDRVTVSPAGAGYGVNVPGGFEDYVKVRAQNAYPIDHLTYDEGALIEPFACVVHALDSVGVTLGDKVLVVGAGPIGLLLLQGAKLCGAQSVTVADVVEEKLAKAEALGADETFVAGDDLKEKLLAVHPNGFDLTIDATGNPVAQEQLLGFTATRGRVLLFGFASPGATMRIEPYDIFRRELKIVGTFGQGDKFGRALALAKAGHVNLADIISHHFPLGAFPTAIETTRGPEISLKILIHPEGDS